jgi:hypothetical protein
MRKEKNSGCRREENREEGWFVDDCHGDGGPTWGWWWNTRPPVMVVVGHGGGLFEGHRRTRRKEEGSDGDGWCVTTSTVKGAGEG